MSSKGDLAVDDHPLIALGALHAAPFVARQIVEDWCRPSRRQRTRFKLRAFRKRQDGDCIEIMFRERVSEEEHLQVIFYEENWISTRHHERLKPCRLPPMSPKHHLQVTQAKENTRLQGWQRLALSKSPDRAVDPEEANCLVSPPKLRAGPARPGIDLCATFCLNASSSALKLKSILSSIPRFRSPGQAEHAFGDNVALNLRSAYFDRLHVRDCNVVTQKLDVASRGVIYTSIKN